MADTDQLSGEDMEALHAVHQHLLSTGDARAPRVAAYLSTQNPSYMDPGVLASRQKYRETFKQEPPTDYPKHMPGTGLDELSGMSLGTGLATAPLRTGLSMIGAPVASTIAGAAGAGPGLQGLAGLVGGAVGGLSPDILKAASTVGPVQLVRYVLNPKSFAKDMGAAVLKGMSSGEEPTPTPKPVLPAPFRPNSAIAKKTSFGGSPNEILPVGSNIPRGKFTPPPEPPPEPITPVTGKGTATKYGGPTVAPIQSGTPLPSHRFTPPPGGGFTPRAMGMEGWGPPAPPTVTPPAVTPPAAPPPQAIPPVQAAPVVPAKVANTQMKYGNKIPNWLIENNFTPELVEELRGKQDLLDKVVKSAMPKAKGGKFTQGNFDMMLNTFKDMFGKM